AHPSSCLGESGCPAPSRSWGAAHSKENAPLSISEQMRSEPDGMLSYVAMRFDAGDADRIKSHSNNRGLADEIRNQVRSVARHIRHLFACWSRRATESGKIFRTFWLGLQRRRPGAWSTPDCLCWHGGWGSLQCG